MIDVADTRPAIADVGPGHSCAGINGQQARVEWSAAPRNRDARNGSHVTRRLRTWARAGGGAGARARGRAGPGRRAWAWRRAGRWERTWARGRIRPSYNGNGRPDAAASIFDLDRAGNAEGKGKRLPGVEIVAIEEVVINVADARPAVPGVGPGDPGSGIDGKGEGIECAPSARDGHVGGAGNSAIGLRTRAGGRAGARRGARAR